MSSMAAKYNLSLSDGPTSMHSETHKMSRGGLEDQATAKFWHPESPLFWLGALGAATLGLAAVSGGGSLRVGPIHASASAGAGK